MSIQRPWLVALALASCCWALAGTAGAQQSGQAQPRAKATKDAPAAAGATDAQLRGRVEHLEEQLADMQIVVGTLESLGRGSAAGAPRNGAGGAIAAPGGGGIDQARIDSLETQIRALTAQLEQLSAQVRQLSGNRRSDAGSPVPPSAYAETTAERPRPDVGGFGSTTITQGERPDPIGRMIGTDSPQPASAAPGSPSSAGSGNPRDLYETAYGYLLQQDYGAAEAAFDEFLRRHPGDRLAADAQYWLGETLYVQRRYKPAGQAFLAVIEKHKASAKVPNSLLKLAQSLEQLGQKDCGIFSELETRHSNAPADVRVKARALKQRQGC
ncbi:MAG: tol-pal system protein YbgF [Hyphomicrobiales bacterium]|nr:tol-pal system protein YbgF [Hyphomicrobiales bacterium]